MKIFYIFVKIDNFSPNSYNEKNISQFIISRTILFFFYKVYTNKKIN